MKSGVEIKLHQKYFNKAGGKVPSSTTALGVISIPALAYAAWKLGTEGKDYRAVWKDLATIGTLTHKMCFARDTKGKVDFGIYTQRQIDFAGICFEKYLKWEAQHTIKIIKLEYSSVSEKYGFGGTFDKLGFLDDIPTLIDYKTGKKFYRSMFYQATSYKHLIKENKLFVVKNKIIKVKDVMVLRFGRTPEEGFEVWKATKEETKLAWRVFLNALSLYKKINQFEKKK